MYIAVECTHMGDSGYTRVNLRVEEATKQRWMDYVDESENYTSLSGLIRACVNREISTEDASTEQGDGSGQVSNGRFDGVEELLERVERIEEHVVEIEQGVEAVEPRGSVPEDLTEEPRPYPETEVFGAIPEGEDVSDGLTVGQISEKLSYGRDVVGSTIRFVCQKSGRVKTERVGDESVYWKEV